MDPRTKELMERALEAERLPPAALKRMSQSLLFRLERGDVPLSGIDAPIAVHTQPALLAKLLTASGGIKLALGVGLSIATGAVLWTLTGSEPRPEEAPVSRVAQATAAHPPREGAEARGAAERDDGPRGQPIAPVDAEPRTAPLVAVPSGAEPGRPEPASTRPTRRAVRTVATLAERSQTQPATSSTSPASRDSPTRDVSPSPAAAHAPQAERERSAPEPLQPPMPAAVDAEFMLLQRAYRELSAGQPARAFPILDEHVRRFPQGALSESREVARMLALCATDQITDARVKADEFLARYPTSTFRARVQRICPLQTDQPRRP